MRGVSTTRPPGQPVAFGLPEGRYGILKDLRSRRDLGAPTALPGPTLGKMLRVTGPFETSALDVVTQFYFHANLPSWQAPAAHGHGHQRGFARRRPANSSLCRRTPSSSTPRCVRREVAWQFGRDVRRESFPMWRLAAPAPYGREGRGREQGDRATSRPSLESLPLMSVSPLSSPRSARRPGSSVPSRGSVSAGCSQETRRVASPCFALRRSLLPPQHPSAPGHYVEMDRICHNRFPTGCLGGSRPFDGMEGPRERRLTWGPPPVTLRIAALRRRHERRGLEAPSGGIRCRRAALPRRACSGTSTSTGRTNARALPARSLQSHAPLRPRVAPLR